MAGFFEAISKNSKGTVFDLGAGSGILSYWAASNADRVYAVELNSSTAKKTHDNLRYLDNVDVICADAGKFSFSEKADIIICEMLDTALIDEEQVPIINSVRKYLKDDGIFIPCSILNCLEPVQVEIEHICYEENEIPENMVLGSPLFYSRINFDSPVETSFDETIKIDINSSGTFNGIKITTFTLLTEDIICGPTPMLNPPLIIPVNPLEVTSGDELLLDLKYVMGGGLESVEARIRRFH